MALKVKLALILTVLIAKFDCIIEKLSNDFKCIMIEIDAVCHPDFLVKLNIIWSFDRGQFPRQFDYSWSSKCPTDS